MGRPRGVGGAGGRVRESFSMDVGAGKREKRNLSPPTSPAPGRRQSRAVRRWSGSCCRPALGWGGEGQLSETVLFCWAMRPVRYWLIHGELAG